MSTVHLTLACEDYDRTRPLKDGIVSAEGITLQQFNESAGGQVVFHLHVHLVPRHEGQQMKPPASIKEEPSVLSDQALKLAAALKG